MAGKYYVVLGLKVTASRAEIRKRFLELAQKYHPDHNPGDEKAAAKFREVREAYDVLYDEQRRVSYDLTGNPEQRFTYTSGKSPENYFFCKASPLTVRLNDEMEVAFSYSMDGRVFKRPAFRDFHVTGPPYVSARLVFHHGVEIKETTLRFIVCPLRQGRVIIEPAQIMIGGKIYKSDPITVQVIANKCFFIPSLAAGADPYKFILRYEQSSSMKGGRKVWRRLHHTVVIPRSKEAFVFHLLGTIIKFLCTAGMAVYLHKYIGIFPALIAGNILGWVNCMVMYKLAGVKSKFRVYKSHPLIQEYLDKGYKIGPDQSTPLIDSSWIYLLGKALI